MFLFDIFKRKDPEPQSELPFESSKCSVTYYINTKGNTAIDISLSDYDDESITAMCGLLNVLADDSFYVETINMIQRSLIEDNQEEVLLKILTHISSQARSKILNYKSEEEQDEPCIKPSDML
jgi:hypothetical protein